MSALDSYISFCVCCTHFHGNCCNTVIQHHPCCRLLVSTHKCTWNILFHILQCLEPCLQWCKYIEFDICVSHQTLNLIGNFHPCTGNLFMEYYHNHIGCLVTKQGIFHANLIFDAHWHAHQHAWTHIASFELKVIWWCYNNV